MLAQDTITLPLKYPLDSSPIMVRSSLFVSLLAAASTAVAAADNRRARENKRLQWAQVPGAYIVEFEEGHVGSHAFNRPPIGHPAYV